MTATTKLVACALALLLGLSVLSGARPAAATVADPDVVPAGPTDPDVVPAGPTDPDVVPPGPTDTTAPEPDGREATTSPPVTDPLDPATGPESDVGQPTRSAPAPAPEAESDDLTAKPPATSAVGAARARTERVTVVPFRDPRRVDLRTCRYGRWTCAIARMHQANGRFLWRDGKVFLTHDGRRVRGHRGHTWTAYRQQARQLVAYLEAVDRARREEQRRQELVRRWSGVAHCESGGRWSTATGNGYYGGLQFNLNTWRAYGGVGYPHQQPAWHQAEVAERLRTSSGLHHWPHCGRHYG
jgi:hypothetical protein